jgi:hypothetical protein
MGAATLPIDLAPASFGSGLWIFHAINMGIAIDGHALRG